MELLPGGGFGSPGTAGPLADPDFEKLILSSSK